MGVCVVSCFCSCSLTFWTKVPHQMMFSFVDRCQPTADSRHPQRDRMTTYGRLKSGSCFSNSGSPSGGTPVTSGAHSTRQMEATSDNIRSTRDAYAFANFRLMNAEQNRKFILSENRPFNDGFPYYISDVQYQRKSSVVDRGSSVLPLRLTGSFSTPERGSCGSDRGEPPSGTRRHMSRCRALKNLVVLGCGCMLWLTAFTSLQNLQSTLNPHRGVGVTSLGCMYATMLMSCFLAPSVIALLGAKWTIVAAYSLFLVLVSANFYPRDFLLVPASLVFGCVAGPLWTAQSTYLTTLSIRYAQTIRELPESTINRFNGVFVGLMQSSQVWGSLISAVSLSADNDTLNLARRNRSCTQSYCGARDCNRWDFEGDDNVPHHAAPLPPTARTWLLSVEAACVVLSVVLPVVLLDRNLDGGVRGGEIEEGEEGVVMVEGGLATRQLLTATVRMLKDSRLQGLAPLDFFIGFQQGFIITDFTKVRGLTERGLKGRKGNGRKGRTRKMSRKRKKSMKR